LINVLCNKLIKHVHIESDSVSFNVLPEDIHDVSLYSVARYDPLAHPLGHRPCGRYA